MANELTTTRDFARVVLAPDWSSRTAGPADLVALGSAIEELENRQPLKVVEEGLQGPLSDKIIAGLSTIGPKIDPTISADQANTWRRSVLLALSDLPPSILARAIAQAIHRPFNFLNQVEGAIRELADESLKAQHLALFRLKRWREEVERAAAPKQPQLESPNEPKTQEDVDRLNAELRSHPARISLRYRMKDGKPESYFLSDEERAEEWPETGKFDTEQIRT